MPADSDLAKTLAFDLGPRDGAPVLFLHGLTGSPAELRFLAQRAVAAGYRAVGPVLPGHGLGAPDLATAGGEAWQRVARETLDSLGVPTHVVGLSMGAILALHLGATAPVKVRSLALLAPALRLAGLGRPLSALVHRAPLVVKLLPTIPLEPKSDLRDPTLAGTNPKNDRLSLFALAELRRLEDQALADARRVRAPALVVLGARDRTISNARAQELVSPLNAQLFWARESGHQVGLDYDRVEVARALIAHFRSAEAAR